MHRRQLLLLRHQAHSLNTSYVSLTDSDKPITNHSSLSRPHYLPTIPPSNLWRANREMKREGEGQVLSKAQSNASTYIELCFKPRRSIRNRKHSELKSLTFTLVQISPHKHGH
ncbi:hypothetical protein Ancab_040374 [Ancistrocladus abbreviatus]